MEINKTQNGDTTTLALSGRLDTETAPQLQAVLLPELETAYTVVLDFSGINYVSSAGLRVLLMGEKSAKAKRRMQQLTNVSADVMDVFEMTGFSAILHFI
jgi:anti-anti-sigma factor